jgi:predicted DCC family thiol-disulfide oxidoreductase YuxK
MNILPNPISAPDRAPVVSSEVSSLTVLYDGDCGVCGETVRQLHRWDHERRFEFLPFQSASSSGRSAIERLVASRGLGDGLHVVDEGTGRVVSGGHAALAILDALPGGWLLRPWAMLPTTGLAADIATGLRGWWACATRSRARFCRPPTRSGRPPTRSGRPTESRNSNPSSARRRSGRP